MKKVKANSLTVALGTSLVSGLAASAAVQANNLPEFDHNPFALTELSSGYMQTAKSDETNSGAGKMKDGACGEGKCGGAMMQGSQEKTIEGKCAGNKPMPTNKKDSSKGMEGKCGEGKCGASMSN